MTPYFQDQFGPWERRSSAGGRTFYSLLLFLSLFLLLILREKSCLLAVLIFLDNSRKWQPAVRKRKMTSKFGLPIVAVRWTDCDSGTPIFWSVSFLVGGGGDLLQEAGVCPAISSCPPPSDDGRPKWDRVFPKCHST